MLQSRVPTAWLRCSVPFKSAQVRTSFDSGPLRTSHRTWSALICAAGTRFCAHLARLRPAAAAPSSRHVTVAAEATEAAPPYAAWTENGAPALSTSGQACVDFLFLAVPGISSAKLYSLLRAAWNEDPLSATKLVFQLGDPRRGKSDRDNHQLCLLWLWRHFPGTVLMNIQSGALTHHTCAKGLLDLLMYAAWDDAKFVETDLEAFPLRGTYAAQQRRKGGRFSHGDWVLRMAKRRQQYDTHRRLRVKVFCEKLAADGPGSQPEDFRVDRKMKDEAIFSRMPWLERQEWISEDVKAQFAEFCRLVDLAKGRQEHEEAKTESEKRRQEVQAKYRASPELQLLYDTVADAFAKPLNDLAKIYKKSLSDERLSREERLQLTGSLLPKWAPTSNGMHDKKTDIVRGIVERIFSPEEFMDPAGTYEDYVSRMKDKYRQEVLTPLRRATEVCEAFVGPQEWEKVNYNRMPARCRLLYGQNVFCKHDKDRYEAHLAAARENKATVKGNVMPHELVAKAWEASQACDPKDPSSALLEVEAQWADLVKEVKQAGHLGRCLAVCDVSCSMDGLPMEVAIALSLLVSEVAEEPWRNKVCSFSMEPSFLRIPPGASLAERTKIVEYMNWDMNTDFMKVFERMLEIAVDNNVPGNEMPETLLVFSDMQFDACVSSTVPWATLHEQIVQKFQSAGYGDSVPLIVYWNLRISPARGRFPVSAEQRGVVTLAGFSQGLLKSFLEHRIETVDPASQMRAMLDSEYFDSVQVAPEDAERQVEPSFASLLCESAST